MDPTTEALAAIDAANGDDPHSHDGVPLALAQGRLAERWVRRLDADASDALRLAARAHHLRRWTVPRTSYPEGRSGYLRWRRDQKTRHALELREILVGAGVDALITDRATTIVAKQGLGTDSEVQVFEDAVSLTFVETQLGSTAEKLDDDDRMVEVIAKTLTKMSAGARAAADTITVDDHSAELLRLALELSETG